MRRKPNPYRPAFRRRERQLHWMLFGLALGAMLAVCIAPRLGNVVRTQLGVAFRWNALDSVLRSYTEGSLPLEQSDEVRSPVPKQMEDKAKFSGDPGIRIAFASQQATTPVKHQSSITWEHPLPQGDTRMEKYPLPTFWVHPLSREGRLIALAEAYADNPEVQSALLRRFAGQFVRIKRLETVQFVGAKVDLSRWKHHSAYDNPPLLVTPYLQATQRGEKLDPTNAYFPFMEAIARFALHQDKEGFAALQRAATKPVWREYSNAEIFGAWRLREATFGFHSHQEHALALNAVIFPHYSQFRPLSFLVLAQALAQERAGHLATGRSLRGQILRIGALMRQQSGGRLGAHVGQAMQGIALHFPNGLTAPSEFQIRDEADSPAQLRPFVTAYTNALQQEGAKAEAAWVERQMASLLPVYDFHESSPFPYQSLGYAWMGNLFLLMAAGVFLLLSLFCGGWLYRRRFQVGETRPLSRSVVWGLTVGIMLPTTGLLMTMGHLSLVRMPYFMDTLDVNLILAFLCLETLGGLALLAGARYTRPLVMSACVAILGLLSLSTLLVWQANSVIAFEQFSRQLDPFRDTHHPKALPFIVGSPGEVVLAVLAPLFLLTLGAALGSWRKKRSFVEGWLRNGQRIALPLASLLLLGYVGLTFYTAHQEATMERTLYQWLTTQP